MIGALALILAAMGQDAAPAELPPTYSLVTARFRSIRHWTSWLDCPKDSVCTGGPYRVGRFDGVNTLYGASLPVEFDLQYFSDYRLEGSLLAVVKTTGGQREVVAFARRTEQDPVACLPTAKLPSGVHPAGADIVKRGDAICADLSSVPPLPPPVIVRTIRPPKSHK